jgi:hypothetical protein
MKGVRRTLTFSFVTGVTVAFAVYSVQIVAAKFRADVLWSAMSNIAVFCWPSAIFLMPLEEGDGVIVRGEFLALSLIANGFLYALVAGLIHLLTYCRKRPETCSGRHT